MPSIASSAAFHDASSTPARGVIVCSGLSFSWPDGDTVLTDLDLVVEPGNTGLIGRNGSGKSTLLRLIGGELVPDAGTVHVAGTVGRLDQLLTLDVDRTVADLLGVAEVRSAITELESGADAGRAAELLTTIGDDWDLDDRAAAELHRFGFHDPDILDRPLGTLSGGETVLAGLVALLLRPPTVTLLDEPTNNLDRSARAVLYDAVQRWPGVLVVVSHDRELLERLDRIVEVRDGRARVFTGPYSHYEQVVAAEQQAALRAARDAEGELRREQRQLVETRIKLDRRERTGRRAEAEKRVPGIIAGNRKRSAQESAGKLRTGQTQKVDAARTALTEAESAIRDDDTIRIDLPATTVPAGRTVLRLRTADGPVELRGPERVALVGDNGAGKTTLMDAIVAAGRAGVSVEHALPFRTPATGSTGADVRNGSDWRRPAAPSPAAPSPGARTGAWSVEFRIEELGYLPQRLDVLDDDATVLDNVRAANPAASPQTIRAGLARFLIGKDQVDLPASALSGGERFRVALARILLADPAPQLLLLDEPTNNLDLAGLHALTSALAAYRGALLLVSHDLPFLHAVGITTWWGIDDGRLRRLDAPPG